MSTFKNLKVVVTYRYIDLQISDLADGCLSLVVVVRAGLRELSMGL